jgi:type II secretory pathway pseudopilin PulG
MPFYRNLAGRGIFSAMEVLVVLICLGIIAAIVGPRMSRGALTPPDTGEQLLVGHLRALRGAIDAYSADHDGRWPGGDVSNITAQFTQFTDRSGGVSPIRTSRYSLGPYLREIPPLPVGTKKGLATLQLRLQNRQAAWVYDPPTGQIWPNTSPGECDASGRSYATY